MDERRDRGGGGDRDAGLLVALRHELRREILGAMFGEGGPVSPRWLSTELAEPLSNVSYHVRVLVDNAAVTLVGTEGVRGSLQHFYVPEIDEPWALAVLGVETKGDDPKPAAERGPSTTEERFR